MKPGRNDLCPCGSGKKYKKCCLAKDEQDAAVRRAAVQPGAEWVIEEDELDVLSNSVLDLIKQRRFDEALAACEHLLTEYPDVVDGLERSALVHAAMGNHALAADFYRRTIDYITHPSRRDEYEGVEEYRARLEEEERLAGLR